MKINRKWHEENKCPKDIEGRVAWHQAHQKRCGCRPVPKGVLAAMEKRKPSKNQD